MGPPAHENNQLSRADINNLQSIVSKCGKKEPVRYRVSSRMVKPSFDVRQRNGCFQREGRRLFGGERTNKPERGQKTRCLLYRQWSRIRRLFSAGCMRAFRRGRGRATHKARHTSRSRGAAFYGRCRSCARGRARWKKADVLPREVEPVSVRSGPSCVKFDAIHVVGNCAQLDGARLHLRRRIKETPALVQEPGDEPRACDPVDFRTLARNHFIIWRRS